MKILSILAAVFGVVFVVCAFALISSWFVMYLWTHCLVGAVDGIHTISWLRALGLSILTGLLFRSSSVSSSK